MKIKFVKVDDVKNFIEAIRRFKSDIDLSTGHYCIDAKSIMGIYSLDISKDLTLTMHARDGETEEMLRQAIADAGITIL